VTNFRRVPRSGYEPVTASGGLLRLFSSAVRLQIADQPSQYRGPGPSASGSVGGIRQFAFVDGKASASDTLRQTIFDTLEFDDPFVDPLRPSARKARPVSTRRDTICRKLAEFRAGFLEGKPDPLREDNKRDPAQYRARITAMRGARHAKASTRARVPGFHSARQCFREMSFRRLRRSDVNCYGASLIAALTSVNFHVFLKKRQNQTPETPCGRVDPLRNFRDEYEESIKAGRCAHARVNRLTIGVRPKAIAQESNIALVDLVEARDGRSGIGEGLRREALRGPDAQCRVHVLDGIPRMRHE
jgi:hypothetical protein